MSAGQAPCGRPLAAHPAPSAESLRAWEKKLRDWLSMNKLKFTEQRWSIAHILLKYGGHLDATQLVKRVKQNDPKIGAATVYRCIKVLCDAGLLQQSLQDAQGRVVFELPDETHHDHIICSDCGEIFEFHNHAIESLQTDIAQAEGFTLSGHRHVIYARCNMLKR